MRRGLGQPQMTQIAQRGRVFGSDLEDGFHEPVHGEP